MRLDEGRLRPVRFVDDHRTDTVTLTEFGIDVTGLDGSRLPGSP